MIEAVVFDIDNTLTNDVSWLKITELLGANVGVHEDIFRRFLAHELPYVEAKEQLLELWQATGNANRVYFERIFADWPLKDGAQQLIDYVQAEGMKPALITGSVDLFAQSISKQLNVSYWYANTTLEWDNTGNLVDLHYIRDQAGYKLTQLRDFASVAGVSLSSVAVVADGDNDTETFRETGHGIVVGTGKLAILKVSWKQVDKLLQVIDVLKDAK